MNDEPVLRASGVHKRYEGGPQTVEVLAGVELELRPQRTLAVVGASGSGKSTLLHVLGGLEQADAGRIEVCGSAWSALSPAAQGAWRNHHVGFVYQFHHLLPEFSALDNVAMPLRIRRAAGADARRAAAAMLDQVGLGARAAHRPGELSGGERQRVALARALVTRPNLLLADEPTGNLDADNAERMVALLLQVVREQRGALVLVTHDRELARRCDTQLLLAKGRLQPI